MRFRLTAILISALFSLQTFAYKIDERFDGKGPFAEAACHVVGKSNCGSYLQNNRLTGSGSETGSLCIPLERDKPRRVTVSLEYAKSDASNNRIGVSLIDEKALKNPDFNRVLTGFVAMGTSAKSEQCRFYEGDPTNGLSEYNVNCEIPAEGWLHTVFDQHRSVALFGGGTAEVGHASPLNPYDNQTYLCLQIGGATADKPGVIKRAVIEYY